MHIHGTAAGASVIGENDRPVGILVGLVEIGIREQGGDRLSRVVVKNIVLADGVIRDLLPADRDGMVALKTLRLKCGSIEFLGLVHGVPLLLFALTLILAQQSEKVETTAHFMVPPFCFSGQLKKKGQPSAALHYAVRYSRKSLLISS